ncbi:hypothetical protein AB0D91_40530 [Streptomyces canus]|uniref:hypothetical protein n=1 Tax=Streptomyces canus TaxID=58343 RepID=UPI0033F2C891
MPAAGESQCVVIGCIAVSSVYETHRHRLSDRWLAVRNSSLVARKGATALAANY